jgi:hypothetical protein
VFIDVPITNRARRDGYLFWRKPLDPKMKALLNGSDKIVVVFGDFLLGEKRVDWYRRRISVGWSKTRTLEDKWITFRLTLRKDGRLSIRCI